MAETALTAPLRSPLSQVADRLAAATHSSGGAIRLAELPFLAQLNVRLDAKGAAAAAVGLAMDLQLPLQPNTVVRAGKLTVLWLGPDEWLLVGPPGSEGDLESRIREAARDEPVSVTDVSAQRTTLLVTGPRARDLLAHGCPLDLHPRVYGAGRCAQTTLGRTQVVLVARDEPRAGFWVLVRSTFAGYLADWLLDAATEYL
ncbi:sarcosine oxidase subunit gamma family protein [Streptomyces sp. ID05-39B]|uniref:sarcosine oxidase subunit gamma n=1 Tax=Streptomyces sp. ID05-39B TaxID=3028664 RepID=UPI0029B4A995|nr:sarcosine oxidase subunit gamma family protein [Streptomyces sp. ID05-39B]MDX3529224.1 sarcosine oxidase subunit gamma family protein [Streptomyces sp. ID05-39B]